MNDRELATLAHLNFAESCREASRWGGGGALEERDGLLLFATGTWVPVNSNGAAPLGTTSDAVEVIEIADEWFAARGRGYTMFLREDADAALRAATEAAGLVPFGEPAPEMVCRRRPKDRPPPDGVELRQIETVADVADFAAVNANAYATYGMPAGTVEQYFSRPEAVVAAPHVFGVVAYDRDRPVAGALTLLSHGIAGVYWVGTVAHARNRGLGEFVACAVTAAGFDLGARANTLQASVMGEPVYRRLGYETLYRYDNRYRLSPPTGTTARTIRTKSSRGRQSGKPNSERQPRPR